MEDLRGEFEFTIEDNKETIQELKLDMKEASEHRDIT